MERFAQPANDRQFKRQGPLLGIQRALFVCYPMAHQAQVDFYPIRGLGPFTPYTNLAVSVLQGHPHPPARLPSAATFLPGTFYA